MRTFHTSSSRPRQLSRARVATAALAIAVAAVVGACTSSTQPAYGAVNFVIAAPLCSSVIPVELKIDGTSAGVDTFRVNVNSPHLVTRNFYVAPGQHIVGARVPGGIVWRDTTLTVVDGRIASDSLPYYCS